MSLTGWMRRLAWLMLPLLLAGCSALRLGYGNGPMLASWWVDSQFDTTAEQAPRVRAALADWFAWHRATQLPDYVQGLAEAATLGVNPVTPAQVCAQYAAWQQRIWRAFDRAVPQLAELARSLSPAQIDHFERHQARRQAELQAESAQPDAAERQQALLKRTVERFETFYGPLEPGQRQLLAAALQASPLEAERWLAERRARNAEVVRSLRQWQAEGSDLATVQAGLRRLGGEVLRSPRPEYAAYSQRLVQANCAMVAQVHNGASATQRQRLVAKLQGWQADLRALADER